MTQPPNAIFSPEYEHLREVLISARQEAGLTQASVAARFGRSAPFVTLFEKGQRRLDVLDFFNLVTALGYDPGEIAQRVFSGFHEVQARARARTPSPSAAPSVPSDNVPSGAR
jgi:transcriptional regulator with XRE-family HTH domain